MLGATKKGDGRNVWTECSLAEEKGGDIFGVKEKREGTWRTKDEERWFVFVWCREKGWVWVGVSGNNGGPGRGIRRNRPRARYY